MWNLFSNENNLIKIRKKSENIGKFHRRDTFIALKQKLK